MDWGDRQEEGHVEQNRQRTRGVHLSQVAGDSSQGCAHRSWWRQLESSRKKKRGKYWGGDAWKAGRLEEQRERDGCIERRGEPLWKLHSWHSVCSRDDRKALAFDRRVGTGLRGPVQYQQAFPSSERTKPSALATPFNTSASDPCAHPRPHFYFLIHLFLISLACSCCLLTILRPPSSPALSPHLLFSQCLQLFFLFPPHVTQLTFNLHEKLFVAHGSGNQIHFFLYQVFVIPRRHKSSQTSHNAIINFQRFW